MGHVSLGHLAVIVAELSGGILARMHPRNEWSTGMMVFPFADVVDLAANDHPAIVERIVLLDLCSSDLAVSG